jgi:hypothetical protein
MDVTGNDVTEKLPSGRSQFAARPTVRVSASRPATGNELTLHFVNYNREVPADGKTPGRGIKDEKPISAPPVQADLKLGSTRRVARAEFLTPEQEQPRDLEFEQVGKSLRVRVPEFLVYGVVRIQLSNSNQR